MTDKIASVYVIDVGRSMGKKSQGRAETDLEFGMKYIWDLITSTVMSQRKTDTIGVVGFRTDESNNRMAAKDPAYENISVLSPIRQFLMPQLRELKENLKPNKTDEGDCVSAIAIAIEMIMTYCKKLKYIRNICLVTNGTGNIDSEGLTDIADQIKAEGIKLTVLGIDFDDEEYGFEEENKDPIKDQNEKLLKNLCLDCDGVFGTASEAVEELNRPRIKKVRPIASYKGKLTLGDPKNKYGDSFSIDVERYPRTMVARAPSASDFTLRTDVEAGAGPATEAEGSAPLQAVKWMRAYQVEDGDAAGGRVEIERDEMEKGYTYGSTVVNISRTDEVMMVMETDPCLEIIGFIPTNKYKRYFGMSTTNIIVGMRSNDAAIMALTSLIHALYEMDAYAVARFVKRKNDPPVILVMAPCIDADFKCLIDVQVPFTEDVRQYKFAPLDKVKTISGKILDKHRNLPTPDMEKYMSDYVDSMDLSTLGESDSESVGYNVDDSFSPVLHRINRAIRYRANNSDEPLKPVDEILVKFSHPPKELVEKAKDNLEKLIAACDMKHVEPKARGAKRKREQPKPKSGLDVEKLLDLKKRKIAPDNAIPDFKRLIENNTDVDVLKDAAKQMLTIIKELITDSFANMKYNQVCAMLTVMRNGYIESDESSIFDDAIQELKTDITAGKLGGNRMDLWQQVESEVLGFKM
ncbi:ATP-dependent DNA helicase yku80 [Rhizina undulata]